MLAQLVKRTGDFLARMPGLPIVVGVGLVVFSLLLQFLPDWPIIGWLAHTHLFLYIGVVLGFVGVLLGYAL